MDAPPVQYVTTSDGYSIAYCVSGEGRAVVLLPGAANNLQFMWQQQPFYRAFFEAMAARYRFIQFDGRGSGLSSRGLRPDHSMENRRLDLEEVVEHLRLDHLLLIAPNETCHVAVPFAVDHPDQVDGLVLWNLGWNQAERGTLVPFEELARRSWELMVRTFAENFGVGDVELEAQRMRRSVTPEDWFTSLNAFLKCNLRPVLPSLQVPTLVLGTQNSAVAPRSEENWRTLLGLIPTARLVLFADGRLIGGLTTDSGIPPAATSIIDFFDGLPVGGRQASVQPPDSLLSSRGVEVLSLVAAGRSNAQIAEELVISLNTVRRHVSNIFAKIGADNRAQAAVYARDHGIG